MNWKCGVVVYEENWLLCLCVFGIGDIEEINVNFGLIYDVFGNFIEILFVKIV